MRTPSSSRSTTSWRAVRSVAMTEDLGPFGTKARDHMARWLPVSLAAIAEEDRGAYFRDLDERVAARIEALERFSMPPQTLQASDPMAYLGRMNMARLMATDQAMAELVYLDPEPGADPDEMARDETGAYYDPGWTSPEMLDLEAEDRFDEENQDP